MKKLFVLFLLLVQLKLHSQAIHDIGTSALDLGLAKTGIQFAGHAAFNRNITPSTYGKIRLIGEFGRLYNLKYTNYSLDVMAFAKPFYLSEFFQLNFGAGLTGGYENLSGISDEDKANIGFMFGAKVGADAEVFVSDQFGFFLFGNQAFMIKKSIGKKSYDVGVGIRIFLNNYY